MGPGHRLNHGRGAVGNGVSRRFGMAERESDGDWMDVQDSVDGPVDKLRTTVTEEHPRSILTFNQSPDIPFDRSVNAYRGCEHGCIYCYARPSHAYHDLSPGLDFETRLFAKPDAAHLLAKALARPGYKPAPIAMGTNTDPYQPIEARYGLTRKVLELCLETRHPVTITTKSDRVLRDIDLLAELAGHGLVAVGMSVTSLDARLSGLLEPRASAPAKRLAALGRLVDAGVPAHVSIAPVIPAITDEYLERILEEAAERGVRSASWIMLRLPHEVSPLFRDWLEVHFPDRAARVMAIVREVRGGKDNDPEFFSRMKPKGVWPELIARRFAVACKRLGYVRGEIAFDCSQFHRPSPAGQLSLL